MPSPDDAIARAIDCFESGAIEADLARRIAIPSESQTPGGLPHCRCQLTAETVPSFEAMGFETCILENPVRTAGPVTLASRIDDLALPTVLG
jgi:hypothetical protein